MTTRAVASLLRRAWLLAAALAVIVGLLGMHVLTSGHGSHGSGLQVMISHSPASPVASAHPSHSAGHSPSHTAVAHSAAAGGHAGQRPGSSTPDAPALASPACGDSCPGAQESGAPCVPSAPGSPVTLSPPQASPAAIPAPRAPGNTAGAGYGYLPPSPTPCDLSISRT